MRFFDHCRSCLPEVSPQLPAYPQQQQAANQEQAEDLQQLNRDQCKDNSQKYRSPDTVQDDFSSIFWRESSRYHADHDGVVSRQNKVHEDDLDKFEKLIVVFHVQLCSPCISGTARILNALDAGFPQGTVSNNTVSVPIVYQGWVALLICMESVSKNTTLCILKIAELCR